MIMRFWLPTMRIMRWMPHLRQRSELAASFQASTDCTRPSDATPEQVSKLKTPEQALQEWKTSKGSDLL